MKLKYKLLLISILFLGFIIFDNSDTYAYTYTNTGLSLKDEKGNWYNNISVSVTFPDSYFDYYENIFCLVTSSGTDSCGANIRFIISPYSILDFNGNLYRIRFKDPSNSNKNPYGFMATSPNLKITNNCSISYNINKDEFGSGFTESTFANFLYKKPIFTTSDICDYNGNVTFPKNMDNPFAEPDKINLYELNLTDMDYNNQQHLFNICTYTNSPCYDEIMDCYNNDYQYAIYLTGYQRYLTYDNEESKKFQYGSYALNGYIDYLVTDKSFFYYSQYYNKVLSNSGTLIFDKDVENYKKRFYFKIVFSEDSNSPNIEIWEDNGSLILGDVKDVAESDYFLGSSQTIYFAEEKSNHDIKSLIDRVFYRGYLKRNDYDPVRKITDNPFYRYNFSYSGGVDTIFYLSDPDYNNKIDRLKYLLNVDYTDRTNFNNQIFNDKKDYIKGDDDSTATFTDKELNKDSTDKDFEDSKGEKRHPTYNNEEDDTNWSILDFLRNIYYTLTGKNNPGSTSASNAINKTTDTVTSKFAFKDNIVNNANEIKDYITNTQEAHKYYLNINHKYLNGNVCIIDLSWYEQYKPTVDAFICAFAYLAFIWHMFCNIPGLISGASAGSYMQDISVYKNTGFGRSSNIHKGGF